MVKKEVEMSAFVISKRSDGNFKFTYASRKGKTIFTSIPCKEKSECKKIIAQIRDQTSSFEFKKSRTGSGKYFFRISKEGSVMATSRKFSTELMLKKGIDQILEYIPIAETLDFSENEDVFADRGENTKESESPLEN